MEDMGATWVQGLVAAAMMCRTRELALLISRRR